VRAANVLLDAEVGGGKAFLVDDEPASLLVKQATLNGNSLTPSDLEWRSNVQGTLAQDATIGTTLDVILEAATHTLTLIADCGSTAPCGRRSSYGSCRDFWKIPVFQATRATGFGALMPVAAVTHIPTLDAASTVAARP